MALMEIIAQKIERIEEHDNADRLSIAFTDVFDWPVVIGKDSFKVGDKVVHFPVDCVLPGDLEELILGNTKFKLKRGRIRAIKIRGTVSYGILVPINKLREKFFVPNDNDKDLTNHLGCHKYEPPVKGQSINVGGKKTFKRRNRNFTKYFDMNHLQNCKGVFKDEDTVIVTEKLHGTSFRAGWVKRDAITITEKLILKLRKLFSKNSIWEFVYGSRNVQLQDQRQQDIYAEMVKKYKLKRLPKDIVVYGEIIGPGIQNNYQYTKEHELFIYDVKENGTYVDYGHKQRVVGLLNLKPVPFLITNTWENMKNNLNAFWERSSILDPSLTVIEGVVIETTTEQICRHGRKKVKLLNPEYLLNKTNTDFH